MALWIDRAHGQDNRKVGVYDSGAVANGTTEAKESRTLIDKLMPMLLARGIDARLAPDGNIAKTRVPWQKANLTKADTFISIHLNSASVKATGVAVFYPDDAPHLRTDCERMSAKLSEVLGIENDGAKPDTSTAVGYVGVLHASDANAMLAEMGFIGNPFDLEAIRTKGAQAVYEAILTILDMPTFKPTPDQVAAFTFMLELGAYTEKTPRNQDRYETAVILSRLILRGLDKRYLAA